MTVLTCLQAFKDNNLRDQSLVGSLSSTLSSHKVNELRLQYGHRTFDFPTVTTQPHLEVLNTFTAGVNRGNPDFYQESRTEIVDNVTWQHGKHTFAFGGDFSHVNTLESFPLFYPFEADFGCLLASQCPFSLQAGAPQVLFFERFAAPNFTEPTFNTSVFQGQKISDAVRHQAEGETPHNYGGLYLQDTWQVKTNLTLNAGLRYQFETFPGNVLDGPKAEFDPRGGFAYNFGGKYNVVLAWRRRTLPRHYPHASAGMSGTFVRRYYRNVSWPDRRKLSEREHAALCICQCAQHYSDCIGRHARRNLP